MACSYPNCKGLFHSPNSGGTVAAAGGEERAVLVEGDGVNGGLVTEIGREQFAGLGVPESHGAVLTGGGQLRAIRRTGDGPNIARISFPGFEQEATPHV